MTSSAPLGFRRWPLVAYCLLSLASIGPGVSIGGEMDEGLMLRDIDGRRERVQFVGWASDGGVTFRRADGETFDKRPSEIVRYGRGTFDRSGQGFLLVDGSWLAGRTWRVTEAVGELRGQYGTASIPRPLIRAMLWTAPPIDRLQEEIIGEALAAVGGDDIVIGVDGDRTSGALQPIEREESESVVWQRGASELVLLVAARPLQIPVARVRAVVFSPLLTPVVGVAADETVVVGLADGSRLHVRRWTTSEEATTFELACGARLVIAQRRWDPSAVVYLSPQRVGGAGDGTSDRGGTRRLSDERPLRMRVQPLVGPARDVELEAESSPQRKQATVARHWYAHPFAMPSAAQAVFRGVRSGGRLHAEVAIRDPFAPDAAVGSVRFRVLVVGADGGLRELWKSELVRGGEGLLPLDVAIPPTAAVILAVEPAARGGAGDRAVWIDPVLVPTGQ